MKATFMVSLTDSLEPHVSSAARKELHALKKLIRHFPDQDLVEIEKTVQSLLKSTRTTLPVLKDRAKALLNGSEETIENFMKDLGQLSTADLKRFGKALDIDLSGAKTENLSDVEKWLESKGEYKPPTSLERAREAAQKYVGNLPERMRSIDSKAAEEILAKSREAYRVLNKDEFQAFASFLGVSVSGSKQKMKKQFEDYVNRAAVIHAQTEF